MTVQSRRLIFERMLLERTADVGMLETAFEAGQLQGFGIEWEDMSRRRSTWMTDIDLPFASRAMISWFRDNIFMPGVADAELLCRWSLVIEFRANPIYHPVRRPYGWSPHAFYTTDGKLSPAPFPEEAVEGLKSRGLAGQVPFDGANERDLFLTQWGYDLVVEQRTLPIALRVGHQASAGKSYDRLLKRKNPRCLLGYDPRPEVQAQIDAGPKYD